MIDGLKCSRPEASRALRDAGKDPRTLGRGTTVDEVHHGPTRIYGGSSPAIPSQQLAQHVQVPESIDQEKLAGLEWPYFGSGSRKGTTHPETAGYAPHQYSESGRQLAQEDPYDGDIAWRPCRRIHGRSEQEQYYYDPGAKPEGDAWQFNQTADGGAWHRQRRMCPPDQAWQHPSFPSTPGTTPAPTPDASPALGPMFLAPPPREPGMMVAAEERRLTTQLSGDFESTAAEISNPKVPDLREAMPGQPSPALRPAFRDKAPIAHLVQSKHFY